MSRPLGKFADFFPSAPSVLEKRRDSKQHANYSTQPAANSDSQQKGESNAGIPVNSAASDKTVYLRQGTRHVDGSKVGNSSLMQDDPDTYSGDLLTGIGSASSSSTVSSVFSANTMSATASGANGLHMHNLTPLTNVEASPSTKLHSPNDDSNFGALGSNSIAHVHNSGGAMTPQHTPPANRSARMSDVQVKGSKCIYDPELDRNLSSKDKRKLKAQYQEFGQRSEDNVAPPDPRLAIASYTRGAAGKAKAKYRAAPYNLKSWSQDPSVTVPAVAAPATMVVVTGFDPLVPLAQITALFSTFGDIGDIDNKSDPLTGRLLGICSITYQDCPSFQGGGPLSASLAAKTAYLEGKKGQRIGLKTVRIEVDKDGLATQKLVERAIILQRKESGFSNTPKQVPIPSPSPSTPTAIQLQGFAKSEGPPPTAPKGPSGKPTIRQTPTSNVLYAPKVEKPVKSTLPSLVETNPVGETLKQPYIFLGHAHVPVLSTTIPHLKKRLRMYDWREVRCDQTGYFVTFEHSRNGQMEAKRVYQGCHMHPLFTYTMNMELYLNGNPAAGGTGLLSPAPALPPVSAPMPVPTGPIDYATQKLNYKLKRERDMDLEEEKRQRARDLDPSRAVVQLVIQELREKLIEDVKSRLAAPVLFDYLDPNRHAEKRRRLGIEDPPDVKRQNYGREDTGSGTPDSRFDSRRPLGGRNLNVLALPKIGKKAGLESRSYGFRDERRKAKAPRPYVRPLFHQLAQFHDEEEDSDDEQRTSITRDTEEPESRPASRMSMTSVSDDDDELLRKATKKRMQAREDSEMIDSVVKEEPENVKTSTEDLIISKLERNIYELSPSSKKRKRLMQELEARKRRKEDDELFDVGRTEVERADSVDVKVTETETPPEATPDVDSDAPKPVKPKPKPKRKTKKQLLEEKEAQRRAEAEAEATEVVDNVMELAEEEEALAEAAEKRPEVEWGVSAEEPQPTVEDDPDIISDLRGWQASLVDQEDLDLLSEVLQNKLSMSIGDVTAWAWKQEQIRNLNHTTQPGVVRREPLIEGYFVRNPSGSARTEPMKKILESEKSKYLPHRIKVQKARERREAEAKRNATSSTITTKTTVDLPKASSRGKRADDRRTVKDLDRQREMLQALGDDADVLRFNQLQKRKKPVKFARSAIHNWGLYSLERIQASEMIIEYVGEKIRQEIADLREVKYTESGIGSSYLFRIDEGTVVDATKKGGIARFINHSCTPNCTAKIIRVGGTKRIVIYALRDIEKGEHCQC